MQSCVNGKKNIVAVFKSLGNNCLSSVKGGCDDLFAVLALELFFIELFNSRLADDIVHSVAVVLQFGIFLGADYARYADNVRGKSSVRIFTVIGNLNVNPLVKYAVFLDDRSNEIAYIGGKGVGICRVEVVNFHFIADRSNFSCIRL